jgi:hypothetical protein
VSALQAVQQQPASQQAPGCQDLVALVVRECAQQLVLIDGGDGIQAAVCQHLEKQLLQGVAHIRTAGSMTEQFYRWRN